MIKFTDGNETSYNRLSGCKCCGHSSVQYRHDTMFYHGWVCRNCKKIEYDFAIGTPLRLLLTFFILVCCFRVLSWGVIYMLGL